jgi:hypothetical protein
MVAYQGRAPAALTVMSTIALSPKAQAINDGGGRFGRLIVAAARRAGLPLPLACALVEQESSFRNVFGHDNVANPIKGGRVTRERFMKYRAFREQGLGANGVGVTQLTFPPFQDRADALGGCWKVRHQLRVGFEVLAEAIQHHGVRGGLAVYNAGSPTSPQGLKYAGQVLVREAKWKAKLA